MRLTPHLQTGGRPSSTNIQEVVTNLARSGEYTQLGVAAAYASIVGTRALLASVAGTRVLLNSQWLFGLDDCLTHPGAIDLARSLPGATVKVAGERINGLRFHPKVIRFAGTGRVVRSALVVGSANLTLNGWRDNTEAVISGTAADRRQADEFNRFWTELWDVGVVPDKGMLQGYRSDFALAHRTRPKPKRRGRELLTDDLASVDPSCAEICWTEVGNITGFQAEQLEIIGEQALFFGLPLGGGPDQVVTVSLASGANIRILAKFYGNQMWRLNFPLQIPEVARGLRPGGARSPYMAVFARQQGGLLLTFQLMTSRQAQQVRRRSQESGTCGRTSAREYGWY